MIPIYATPRDSNHTVIGEMDNDTINNYNQNTVTLDKEYPKRPADTKAKKKKKSVINPKTRNPTKSNKNKKPHGSKPVPIEHILGVKPKTTDTNQYSELDDHVETDINR